MKSLYYINLVLYLFVGVNVLQYIGWKIEMPGSNIYYLIFPSFYIILFLFIVKIILNPFLFKNRKEEVYLLILVVSTVIIQVIRGNYGFLANIINCITLPVLMSFLVPVYVFNNKKSTNIVKNILIVFYLVECVIAIYERYTLLNIFPFNDEIYGNKSSYDLSFREFRSTSLQNHPLQNAFCIAIIMSFIIIANIKYYVKYLLWIIGFIALLCFNARSSIIGLIALMCVYIAKKVFSKDGEAIKEKYALAIILPIGIFGIYLLMIDYGWGARLLDMGLFDESSAQVRVQIWDVFKYYQIEYFIWGSSNLDVITSRIGVDIIENYWLIYIFKYGIIVTSLLFILFCRLFSRILRGYSNFQKTYVLICFILISSTNNSLAVATPALAIFILCTHAFKPKKVSVYDTKNNSLLLVR